jgi:hypothetical protein
VNFAISSLALNFLEEYNVTVSSKSSGGEHDSTGLGAKQKLITPLLRCASPETATLYSELFETTQQNKKGSHRLPFLHLSHRQKLPTRNDHGISLAAIVELEFDVCGDAKLGGGGAGPSNAGDDAGRAMKRDWWIAAGQGALSSGQG